VALPEGQSFTNTGRQVIAISPDGTEFVYVANRRLYRRTMSDLLAQAIPGIDGSETVRHPVYSPDGRSIVYFGGDVLRRIAVTGGAPMALGTFRGASGMSWGPDGIVFANDDTPARGILRVSPNGGTPEQLVTAAPEEAMYGPQVLPGGHALLFSVARNTSAGAYAIWDKAAIVVQRLDSSERQTLITDGSDARYVASGHIVYARGGVLFAVPFDLGRLHVSGAPTAVVQGVARATAGTTAAAQFAVASSGSLVYLPGPADTNTDTRLLAIFDRMGGMTPVRMPAANINHPRVSPDGKRVVFAIDDDTSSDVWTYDLAGSLAVRRITFGGRNRFPIWTSDGLRVVFQSDREGDRGIYWQRADGASAAERLTKAEGDDAHVPESWSPPGDGFLFQVAHGLVHTLQFYSLKNRTSASFGGIESRAPTVAVFSPDGRWVAYENGEYTGADRAIYVQPFPETGARYEVPRLGTGGQRHPRWSSDGRELFFMTGGEVRLLAAGVTTQPSLTFANPVVLPKHIAWMDGFGDAAREWDVLPDNQHFIGKMWAINAAGGSRASQTRDIQVVINWFEELKARVPTK
jgi:Tol biopolymer transport system component